MKYSDAEIEYIKNILDVQSYEADDMADKVKDAKKSKNWRTLAHNLRAASNIIAELNSLNLALVVMIDNSRKDNVKLQEIVSKFMLQK